MVASNRERQAAFRARKKIQPLAEKHFGGEHYVNLGEFLTVMKFDEATFRSLLPEGKSDGLPPDLVLDLMAEVHEFEEGIIDEKLKDDELRADCERVASELAEQNFYIKDTKEWLEFMRWEVRGVAKRKVKGEVDAFEEKLFEDNKEAIEKAVNDSVEYPLYQLVDAYKRSLAIP